MRPLLTVVMFGLASALLCGAALVAQQRRQGPASGRFAVVAGIAGVGSLLITGIFALNLRHTLFIATVVLVALGLPLPWLLFSFEYTGRTELVSTTGALVVAAPIVAGFAATSIIFGSQLVPWLRLPSQDAASGLTAVTVTFLSTIQWLTLLYAGGLMLVGSGALLWTFHRYEHLDSSAGMLLGVFGVVPWLSLLIGLQIDGIALSALSRTTGVGFIIGGCAATGLVGTTDLFKTVPAAGNIGPATIIEELDDIVVVTDGEGTVVEINAVTRRQLGLTTADVVGGHVTEVLDAGLAELKSTENIELRSVAGRTVFEPDVSALTDQHDSLLGHAIVLRDVTERITRRQRLEVFNRVFRHNLSNEMNVVLARARMLQEESDDSHLAENAAAIIRSGETLIELSETVQDVEEIIDTAGSTTRRACLAPLVEEVLTVVKAEHRGADYKYNVPADIVIEGPAKLLELALTNLVENAVVHNDSDQPCVKVSGRYHPNKSYPLCITVTDNGPGIPENERNVIEGGGETPLQHGLGIGLWAVRWAATGLGGQLELASREPRGTVISLRLPQARRENTTTEQPPADHSE